MIGIFSGIRVIELGQAIAAAWPTKAMASQGAEVISIEIAQRPNILRGSPALPSAGTRYPNYGLMKLGITLDLRQAEGRRLMRELLRISDIFIQNYSPEAIARFGLEEPAVREINPSIIYLGLPGVGSYGPYRNFSAFGIAIQAMGGLNHLIGYLGEEAMGPAVSYPDYVTGTCAAFVLAAALDHRRRTDSGMHMEMSLYEAMATSLSTTILEYTANGHIPTRMGNRDPRAAPHGYYRCQSFSGKDQGEDRWCAIAVFEDEEWLGLCQALGNPPWTKDLRFATLAGRKENEDELDRLAEEWTINYDAWEVMYRLQRAGVPAGVVEKGSDSGEGRDIHLKRREFMEVSSHPDYGNCPAFPVPIRFSETRCRFGHTPAVGEHDSYVYKRLLGMSDEEMERLKKEGVI